MAKKTILQGLFSYYMYVVQGKTGISAMVDNQTRAGFQPRGNSVPYICACFDEVQVITRKRSTSSAQFCLIDQTRTTSKANWITWDFLKTIEDCFLHTHTHAVFVLQHSKEKKTKNLQKKENCNEAV